MLWWDHVTTVHRNILGQQQEALRGEQVGQGCAAILSFLPDEPQTPFPAIAMTSITVQKPPLYHRLSPGSSHLLLQAAFQALWDGISEKCGGSQVPRAFRPCWPFVEKQDFFLNISPTSCALCTGPQA